MTMAAAQSPVLAELIGLRDTIAQARWRTQGGELLKTINVAPSAMARIDKAIADAGAEVTPPDLQGEATNEVIAAAQAEIERLTEETDSLVATILEAVEIAEQVRDLLLLRIKGNPARSFADNAVDRADSLIALLTAKTGRPS